MTADEITAILMRHTDEDQTDLLHILIAANNTDEVFLAKVTNALHASNIIRADGTESPTI